MYWRSSMIFCVVVLIKVILCPCNTVPSRSLDLYRGRCSFSKKSVKHLAKLASTNVTNDHKTCLWNAVSDIAKSQNSSENIFSNWLLSLPFRPIILNKTIRFFVLEAKWDQLSRSKPLSSKKHKDNFIWRALLRTNNSSRRIQLFWLHFELGSETRLKSSAKSCSEAVARSCYFICKETPAQVFSVDFAKF